MNTSLGYAKKTLTNSNVLLSGGGDKALSEFIGSLNWDSTNKKLQYKSASSTDFTDLITFGSNAFTSTSYLPLAGGTMTGGIIRNNGGTWFKSRDNAIIKSTVGSGDKYYPAFSMKTANGDWSIGSHGMVDGLRAVYNTDENYNNSNN